MSDALPQVGDHRHIDSTRYLNADGSTSRGKPIVRQRRVVDDGGRRKSLRPALGDLATEDKLLTIEGLPTTRFRVSQPRRISRARRRCSAAPVGSAPAVDGPAHPRRGGSCRPRGPAPSGRPWLPRGGVSRADGRPNAGRQADIRPWQDIEIVFTQTDIAGFRVNVEVWATSQWRRCRRRWSSGQPNTHAPSLRAWRMLHPPGLPRAPWPLSGFCESSLPRELSAGRPWWLIPTASGGTFGTRVGGHRRRPAEPSRGGRRPARATAVVDAGQQRPGRTCRAARQRRRR
jgi:hypothetical protein